MRLLLAGASLTLAIAPPATAQEPANPKGISRLEIAPATLQLAAGDSAKLSGTAFDAANRRIETTVVFFGRATGLIVRRDGWIKARAGGTYVVRGRSLDARGIGAEATVTVPFPPVQRVVVTGPDTRLFVGSQAAHRAWVYDAMGNERPDVPVRWSTSAPAVATVNSFGIVTAVGAGPVRVEATAEKVTGEMRHVAEVNPVRTLRLSAPVETVRTGDVVHFTATPLDAQGKPVERAPITYSVTSVTEDTVIAQSPAADIDRQGRFVAQKAGLSTVVASLPGVTAQKTIQVTTRNVSQDITLVGRSPLRDVRTSDLYVWQGKDGRDYMIAGAWEAGGQAYFYDVTDAAHQVLLDSIVVDARTVNDVYVDGTGTICVITREGASNRKNGVVLIDCADPRHPKILANYDEGLTGGVHNVNIWTHYLFAINNGTRFDILDIADPRHPVRVGVFELPTEGHAIHDVWVDDGIAYASQWKDGVILVDVGNGKYGGSPEHPKQFASYRYPLGATHAAYPFRSATGKFYVIAGDEITPPGPQDLERNGVASEMRGYAHIIDFTDPQHPEEVARYEVPEAGSHNFWVEGDKLYATFYNGGLRVVDLSGELKGNLFYQGREIARFMPRDPQGFQANSPNAMGAQLYKGNIFFADFNSGMWTVKLQPLPQALTP